MTRWIKRGVVSGVVLGTLGLGLVAPGPVAAQVLAEVRLRGGILPDTTVGGLGDTLAQWADANTFEDSIHTRESAGELTSNAAQGRMEGAIFSEILIPGSFSRTSDFVQMFLSQQDTYTIGPGTSGLSNGDPVRVRIQARAFTRIVLTGSPSASSELRFNVEGVPGLPGRWVDWSFGPISPPQELEFDEDWEVEAETTVGSSFSLVSNLYAQIGSNAYTGPLEDAERNDATGLSFVRVSPGQGYGGIEITTEAGAPTTPLPVVPGLTPLARIVLVASLAVLALALFGRPIRAAH